MGDFTEAEMAAVVPRSLMRGARSKNIPSQVGS